MMQSGNSGNGNVMDQKHETDLIDKSFEPSRMKLPIQTFPRVIEQSRDQKRSVSIDETFSVGTVMPLFVKLHVCFDLLFISLSTFFRKFSTMAFRRIAYAWLYI